MNIPSFKSIPQKLSVLRHNSSLLVAVIIAVVAIVLFIPTQLISSKLKGQIADESLSKGKAIQNMDALSREQWKEEEKYQQSYANDANQIKLLAEQSSKRELLSYKIFPETKDESALIFEEFGDQFRKGADELIAGLNATECPSDAELEQNLQSSSVRNRLRGRRAYSGSSFPSGRYIRGSSFRIMNDIDATIVDEICLEKAKSSSIYAQPADVSGYEFWKEYQHPGREEAVKDCWYWQLGYWVVGDVIDTIAACNAGSKSVFTSPVKRLMRVSFTLSERRAMQSRMSFRGQRAARKSSSGDKPSYVLSVQDGLTQPCTGRFSNEDIDVIHFDVAVLVRADAVLPFMQKLCSAKEHKFKGWDGKLDPPKTYKHNQITILESNIRPVEQEMTEHMLYRYGEDAVVELELICEYIFNKAGYDPIQPDSIKKELKGEEDKQ
jgi:hypothetical protein